MILKYPENICMLCIPMVMYKNPSDKSIYHWDFYALWVFEWRKIT
nr:tetracycline resistance determinant leader peptide [Enterococcus hirae]